VAEHGTVLTGSTLHLPYRVLAVSLVTPLRPLRTAKIAAKFACDDLAAGC